MVCSEEDEAGINEWENVGKGKNGKAGKERKNENPALKKWKVKEVKKGKN